MELASLDQRGMAEKPQFLQFLDPETSAPLADGETKVGAWIKGAHARSVQAAIAAKGRAELVSHTSSRKALEDVQADLVEAAVVVTDRIEGVTSGGLALTPAQFATFYDTTFLDVDVALGRKTAKPGSFAQQVARFANEASRFLTVA